MKEETKCIRIGVGTYFRLAQLGDLTESFDSVIRKLIDKAVPEAKEKEREKKGEKEKENG